MGREAAAWRAVADTSGAGAHPGVWELAWPTIVSNLLFSASGFIDIKIVGSLGASAVAAITTGTRIFFTAQAVLMAILAGTTALVARAWGAGHRDEAAQIAELSLWLCLVVSALLTLGGTLGADALAGLFRLEPQTVALAATFTRWLSVFYMAFAAVMALSTALRAAGDVVTPLWIGALGNVVSVFFTYSLVHGTFGLPALGVAGAAIGNGTGFVTGALLLTALWRSGRLVVGTRGARAFRWELIQRLVRIGYPAALEQVAWQGGFVAFLWVIALYGTAPYAAYGIGVNLLSFSFVVGFGFSVAASTVVGQRLGARDPEGATRGGWRAMRLAIGVMLVFGACITAAARPLATFLIDDREVVRLTVAFIYVLGSVQALMAIEFCVRFTLAALFAWRGLRVEWVFAALIADYLVKATMFTLRFRSRRWVSVIREQGVDELAV